MYIYIFNSKFWPNYWFFSIKCMILPPESIYYTCFTPEYPQWCAHHQFPSFYQRNNYVPINYFNLNCKNDVKMSFLVIFRHFFFIPNPLEKIFVLIFRKFYIYVQGLENFIKKSEILKKLQQFESAWLMLFP